MCYSPLIALGCIGAIAIIVALLDSPAMDKFTHTTSRWIMRLRDWDSSRLLRAWKSDLLGLCLIVFALGTVVYWFFNIPPSNYSLIAMAVIAGLMGLRENTSGLERSIWALVIILLAVIAVTATRKENIAQQETLKDERQHFSEIGKSLEQSITQSQAQFSATMDRSDRILSANTEMLGREDKNLTETMGGEGYPAFHALPSLTSPNAWPVMIITPGTSWPHGHIPTDSERAPLIDLTVSVSVEPQPDFKTNTVDAEDFESMFFSQYYNVGNMNIPEMRTAPFKLIPGKKYILHISTRRKSFTEIINMLHRDPKSVGGWNVSWCISEDRLFYGKNSSGSRENLLASDGKCND
jgi:hypothetical protein